MKTDREGDEEDRGEKRRRRSLQRNQREAHTDALGHTTRKSKELGKKRSKIGKEIFEETRNLLLSFFLMNILLTFFGCSEGMRKMPAHIIGPARQKERQTQRKKNSHGRSVCRPGQYLTCYRFLHSKSIQNDTCTYTRKMPSSVAHERIPSFFSLRLHHEGIL